VHHPGPPRGAVHGPAGGRADDHGGHRPRHHRGPAGLPRRLRLAGEPGPGGPGRAAAGGVPALRFDDPQPELAAYPSLLASLISEQPLPPVTDETLLDNRPRGSGTLTAGGAWLRFDITALYRTWARGGPFPSQGRAIEPGTPRVVDVRPPVVTEPYFEARFAGLDGDRDTAPQLRWRVTRGC
jgi:hypothetical protein